VPDAWADSEADGDGWGDIVGELVLEGEGEGELKTHALVIGARLTTRLTSATVEFHRCARMVAFAPDIGPVGYVAAITARSARAMGRSPLLTRASWKSRR
jgi:hypothetical protein